MVYICFVMTEEDIGTGYLRIFDSLDLESRIDRRLSVYVLEEFFGMLMTEVARDALGSDADIGIHRLPLRVQVGQLLVWLGPYPISSDAKESETMIEILTDLRNSIAHNFLHDVNRDQLVEIREDAERWREWLWSEARKIDSALSQREVVEAKIQYNLEVTEDRIRSLLEEPLSDDQEYEVRDHEILFDACKMQFEEYDADKSTEVSTDLVSLLMLSYDVRANFTELEQRLKNTESTSAM